MYESLEIPKPDLEEDNRCLKEVSLELFSSKDISKVAPYFDYLIQSLIP